MTLPRTLRRYIALRFAAAMLGTLALCSILIFMIDIVELLRQAGKFGRVPTLDVAWMALLRLPAYTEILLPFCVLVGSIAALLTLNRKSELAVMRASGMSAWQFLRPGIVVAFLFGILAVTAYNPLAAWSRGESERLFAKAFGREATVLRSDGAGAWLRQDGAEGSSVLNAGSATNQGRQLTSVMVIQFDKLGHFVARVDGVSATLEQGFWQIHDATVARIGQEPKIYPAYKVSTYLTPDRVADALGAAMTVSFWELPGLIELTEKAGLSASRFRVQYEILLARPIMLVAMVLLAATVSLRSFRSGGIQTMVITGMIGGFGFFLLAEISRQAGSTGLAPAVFAVWVPVIVTCCASLTVLAHQEDG